MVTTGSSSEATSDASSGSASESAGETGDATTEATSGEPLGPPTILEIALTPPLLETNGDFKIVVKTAGADAVSLAWRDAPPRLLEAAAEGSFFGEIPAYSALWNGEYVATFTPARGELLGAPVQENFKIALPQAGKEKLWETGFLIGVGSVKAIEILPSGEIREFGTRWIDDFSMRCYLRRRAPDGSWSLSDLREVLPGVKCDAIDMKVGPDGQVWLLADRWLNNLERRWWLGKAAAWDKAPVNHSFGAVGEVGAALALPTAPQLAGTVVVCGEVPTVSQDKIDLGVWVMKSTETGLAWRFDRKDGEKVHAFAERARDCAVVGEQIVVVGEMNGKHDNDKPFDRHFIFQTSLKGQGEQWKVASGNLAVQSGARAVTVDDQGRILTTGYTCGADCQPVGSLRIHDAEGELLFSTLIGEAGAGVDGPHDIMWHPAGYVLVALGVKKVKTAFTVQAFAPLKPEPLWTYKRDDTPWQIAYTIGVGLLGQICVGGLGADGYPALACLSS